MRSKLLAITARTPSSAVPFAAQSRELPVPYSSPAITISGMPCCLVLHRRVVDRHLLAVGQVLGQAAFDARHEQVLEADVRERAAHHDLVVAAARAVLVEVLRLHAVRVEVLRRRAVLRDVAGRRDVIGRDRVAEHREHARALDVAIGVPVFSVMSSKNGGLRM